MLLVVLDVDEGEPDHSVKCPVTILVCRDAAELLIRHLVESRNERGMGSSQVLHHSLQRPVFALREGTGVELDRKSTRLNSSH